MSGKDNLLSGEKALKTVIRYSLITGLFLLAAGCQAVLPSAAAPTAPPKPASIPAATAIPLPSESSISQPSDVVIAAPSPTAGPSASQNQVPAGAIQAATDYFSALAAGDYRAASMLLSTYSLVIDGTTRDNAAAELETALSQGTKFSEFEILDSRVFDEKTALVHVTYQRADRDAKTGKTVSTQVDELWPVRLDASSGTWLYNRNNLIDFHTLDVPELATAGLTIKPRMLVRYSDHLRMVFLAQNGTNEAIVLGQPSEVMAAFAFGDQKIEAEKTRLIFDRLRSYPEAVIDVKGLFEQYPDGVEIRRWKNYNVAPWFTFDFDG